MTELSEILTEVLPEYYDPWRGVSGLPASSVGCQLTFSGYRTVRPYSMTEVPWSEFAARKLSDRTGVYVGILPYEFYTLQVGKALPRVYRLSEWSEFDQRSKQIVHKTDLAASSEIAVPWPRFAEPNLPAVPWSGFLRPYESQQQYLSQVEKVIEQIRAGRYYQLNLLRYFHLGPDPTQLRQMLAASLAPFKCWFKDAGSEVISFSPERFIKMNRTDPGLWHANAYPIKGTASRGSGVDLNLSKKDQAELSMIIDLMRNDLGEIAQPNSVFVPQLPAVKDFGYVRHLVGQVAALIDGGLTVGEFFRAVLPAGSITGAPKQEVVLAIREFEQRPRDFFMGNAFWLDLAEGLFDSNVLIRTAQTTENGYEFAAGSGIVIKSNPGLELAEIKAKCSVLGEIKED